MDSKKIGFVILASLLSGCANHPVDCAIGFTHDDCLPGTAGYVDPEKFAKADDQKCQSYGLAFGTPEYAQCRMAADAQRSASRAARLSPPVIYAPPATPYVMSTRPITNTTCSTFGGVTNCQSQ
jgi:hypothetical protein